MLEFDESEPGYISVLPVSVFEIGAQESTRRRHGEHYQVSSRSDYSHFPAEALALCLELYLRDCRTVFDPFAGWGERARATLDTGKTYIGYDVNPIAIETANREHRVSNYLADSLTATIPLHDALLTCPPYWNLEKYSPDGIEQAKTWEEFLRLYFEILGRCYNAAQTGAVYCVLVAGWRKDHTYYDLTHQTKVCMYDHGATLWDEVIISRRTVSKIKVMLPQAKRLGYSVKVHDTLLVFQKR